MWTASGTSLVEKHQRKKSLYFTSTVAVSDTTAFVFSTQLSGPLSQVTRGEIYSKPLESTDILKWGNAFNGKLFVF